MEGPLAIGDCLTFFISNRFTEGIIIDRTPYGDDYTYEILCFEEDKFFIITTTFNDKIDTERSLSIVRDVKPILNTHFFTINEITDTLISMRGDVILKLLAKRTAFSSPKCLSKIIVFQNGSKFFKIVVSENVFKDGESMKYVYCRSYNSNTNIKNWLSMSKPYVFKEKDVVIIPKRITRNRFTEFNGETILAPSGLLAPIGIDLGECMIFDYDDFLDRLNFGNGCKFMNENTF